MRKLFEQLPRWRISGKQVERAGLPHGSSFDFVRKKNAPLVASGLADQPTPMPWFGDKKLIIQFA